MSSKKTTRVFCTGSFEALHRWKDAPEHVAYLRDLHRHVFHWRLEKKVEHDDRDIEFITLKNDVDLLIYNTLRDYPTTVPGWSCEMWARHLLDNQHACRVEVSEDKENGAIVECGE
jgi:hypothetical protein